MISLALRRKVPITEDVLTAALFDYLRLNPCLNDLRALFARVRPFASERPHFEFDSSAIELWPSDCRAGEPDVRIELSAKGGVTARVLVEVKLGAAKSGVGEVSPDRCEGDQLARYLIAEAEDHPHTPAFLLYLTHHLACPRDDLNGSAAQLCKANRPDLVDHLLWLPWCDVLELLEDSSDNTCRSEVCSMILRVVPRRFKALDLHQLGTLGIPDWYSCLVARPAAAESYFGTVLLSPPLREFDWSYRRSRQRVYSWPLTRVGPAAPKFYNRTTND